MQTSRFHSALLLVALAAALVLVVVLAVQKEALLDQYQQLATQVTTPYPGFYVPEVRAATLAGDSVTIGKTRPAGLQVLFVLRTTCDFCRASLGGWTRIARELQKEVDVEVYGLSLDSLDVTRRYVEEHAIRFPLVSFTDRKLHALYRSIGVPQTLVLDGMGMVRYARMGSLADHVAVDSVLQASGTVSELILPAAVTDRGPDGRKGR